MWKWLLYLLLIPYAGYNQHSGGFVSIGGIYQSLQNVPHEVIITVYEGDQIIQLIETGKNGEFLFTLPYQKDYLIRFDNPAYVSVMMHISTYVPQDKTDLKMSYSVTDIPLIHPSDLTDISSIENLSFTDIYYDVKSERLVEDTLQNKIFRETLIFAM